MYAGLLVTKRSLPKEWHIELIDGVGTISALTISRAKVTFTGM